MRTLDSVYGADADGFPLEQLQDAIRETPEWDAAADLREIGFADREGRTPWRGFAFE